MSEPGGLERLARACASVRVRVAVATAAVVVAAGATAILLLSLFPVTVREGRGSVGPLAIAAAWLAGAGIILALSRRAGRRLDPLGLAAETDGAVGLGAGDVQAALEMGRARGSRDLAALHRERVSRNLEGLDADRLFPLTGPRWKRRARGAAAIGGLTLVALVSSALLRPEPTWSAAAALGAPWRTAFPVALPPLALEREGPVRQGERLGVRISAAGRTRVTLVWRPAGESARRRELEVGNDGIALGRTAPITGVTRVWAEDLEGAGPDTLTVRPVEPLLVQDLHVEVVYPAYLARPRDEHRGQVPPLVAPEGTRLLIRGEANLPLDGGALTWRPPDGEPESGGPAPVPLELDDTVFSATITPRRSGEWSWSLEAAAAIGDPILPDPIRVLVVPDLPPDIRLLFPAPDTLLGPDRVMPLVVDAGDDIGLLDVVLRSWRSGLGEEREERREVLEPRPDRSRRAVFRHLLDRSHAELLPGDTIFYRFEAHDGHPTRGPALSDVFLLRVPTLTEIRQDRAARTEGLSESARQLEDAVDALAEAAEDAARRAATEPEQSGFETTEEARSVLEDAERAAAELEELEDEVAGMRDELARSELDDPALEEQLERLAERYEELRESGLLDRIEELAEALRELDPETMRAALERLSEDSEWLREQLEQTLGLLDQAALDQAVKSAQADARDLADRQRELAEGDARDAEEWAAEEERLAERAEALSEALDEIETRLEEAGREAAADSAGQAGGRSAEAAGEMREAAADTREAARSVSEGGMEGPTESSRASAQEAAAAMEEAAEALGSAQQGMQQQDRQAASEALGRARSEALALAGEEGQLADATSGSEARDPATWQARQGAVRQGLDNLLERLSASGSEAAMIDRETSAAAGEAAARMDDLLERLAEDGARRLPSRAEAEGVQESLNQLAMRLLGAEQAARASEQQAQGRQAGEQMQSLARQQQGVTQETSSLLTPGPRPSGQERRAEELSGRQQEIADGLDELEDPEGELLGRPEELAAEARELARRLAESGPSQETLERQRRLFRRMLDAGRSLEDEDLDPNRRESETGRAFPREPPEIDPELLRGRRFPLPPEALLRELPVFYRPLIFEYFDRLNRPARPPASGAGGQGSGDDGGR